MFLRLWFEDATGSFNLELLRGELAWAVRMWGRCGQLPRRLNRRRRLTGGWLPNCSLPVISGRVQFRLDDGDDRDTWGFGIWQRCFIVVGFFLFF